MYCSLMALLMAVVTGNKMWRCHGGFDRWNRQVLLVPRENVMYTTYSRSDKAKSNP